jgi:hypothetical protein
VAVSLSVVVAVDVSVAVAVSVAVILSVGRDSQCKRRASAVTSIYVYIWTAESCL